MLFMASYPFDDTALPLEQVLAEVFPKRSGVESIYDAIGLAGL